MDSLEISRRITDRLTALNGATAPRFRSWTGEEWGEDAVPATVVLEHPGALRALLLPLDDLTSAEAYLYGDVDVEGSMLHLLDFAAGLEGRLTPLDRLRILRLARKLPAGFRRDEAERPRFRGMLHSIRRDKASVTHHYDTGNDFFAQFLDPRMVYSCAHFLDPNESLEIAQRRKLDLICRKLQLSKGDRLLDVGCGWGALVNHAAQNYGVEATGITLSRQQAEFARLRSRELGVEARVTILEADYREVDGRFDAIASVGMVEHVGRKKLPEYFSRMRQRLAPGGQFLNHGITTRDRNRPRRPKSFVMTYVFPDGELRPVEELVAAAEAAGFELRDLESLRRSYAITLRNWVANLEANAARAIDLAGDRVYRIWRLYMAGAAISFEQASISVYQMLLSDPARPWTWGRRHLLATDDS